MDKGGPSELTVPQQLLWTTASAVLLSGRIHEGRVQIRFTPALRVLWGVQRPLRGGPLLNAWVHDADRARVQQALARLVDVGESVDMRYRIKTPDTHQERWLHLVLQRLPDDQRVTGILRDNSAEQAHERDRVLTQQRLQSVSRLTLLGEVASGLAHELNQPLAAMATFAQAGERLLSMPAPQVERAQQIFTEISQQALRAGEIIQRMRNLVRRHNGQRTVVSCVTLLNEFLAVAEPMARATRVALQTKQDTGAACVDVDSAQILQVLMNLFQNALEAARDNQRPPQVSVESRLVAEGVEIAIADSGAGVSDEVAAQLFKPFFSTKSNGSGLGLSGSRKILESYGSRLNFANQAGGGCRFYFSLAVSDAPRHQ